MWGGLYQAPETQDCKDVLFVKLYGIKKKLPLTQINIVHMTLC